MYWNKCNLDEIPSDANAVTTAFPTDLSNSLIRRIRSWNSWIMNFLTEWDYYQYLRIHFSSCSQKK